ncbi:hypothetical protein NUM_30280 [Actinocatenispora comari]|uniref:Uncharacterized protein n=1 Tax=Actinocatenispora comari TaxID=2807577 RepID=A0A8J4ENK6_9ACTN|nr:hypothetical protein NUM_30280 [Actinocatenispora comari]
MVGSSTSSIRTSLVPCQASAFTAHLLAVGFGQPGSATHGAADHAPDLNTAAPDGEPGGAAPTARRRTSAGSDATGGCAGERRAATPRYAGARRPTGARPVTPAGCRYTFGFPVRRQRVGGTDQGRARS